LSNLLMNKRRKECYEEIEGKRDRQTEKQTQTYLNIALCCNDSIHRCLSKRVKCFVKPPHEEEKERLFERARERERQTERQTDRKSDRHI
jgi:hypothetical protein